MYGFEIAIPVGWALNTNNYLSPLTYSLALLQLGTVILLLQCNSAVKQTDVGPSLLFHI